MDLGSIISHLGAAGLGALLTLVVQVRMRRGDSFSQKNIDAKGDVAGRDINKDGAKRNRK